MEFQKGMIIKMTGLSVKKENGVFEIDNLWEKSCPVYKLKKDGSRIKHGLDIFNYDKIEKYGQIITSEEIPAAISEINKQLKARKENEIVISYESTDKKEITNNCYIRVIEPIHTTNSIYAIPRKSTFQLTINEKWNSVTWQRIGKKGELLSNYNGENMMNWKISSMEKLFTEGYIEIVERVETVRKDMDQEETPVNETTEEIQETEVIENVTEETIVNSANESIENEIIETKEENSAPADTQTSQISYQTGTGNKGNGIEITFENKPSEEVRNAIKATGYRWGGKQRPNIWWAIETTESLSIAEQLAGENNTTNEPIENTFSYPEIEIDDNDSYTIDQSLQDREHDSNWVFRQNKRDHNKEIQELFTSYTISVKEIITNIDNEYYIYKIKSALQSFKKKYHQAYINWLSSKASQPHWAVSGRGNLNKSRYDKALSRQDKWMNELVNLPKELESTIKYYQNKIRKDKEVAIKEAVKNTNIELIFKTVTKEGMRFYCYGNYAINRNWGTFRIYYNGKEIHSMKTTETLNDAKKYVAYLIQSQAS